MPDGNFEVSVAILVQANMIGLGEHAWLSIMADVAGDELDVACGDLGLDLAVVAYDGQDVADGVDVMVIAIANPPARFQQWSTEHTGHARAALETTAVGCHTRQERGESRQTEAGIATRYGVVDKL